MRHICLQLNREMGWELTIKLRLTMVSDPNLYIDKLEKSSTVAFSCVKNLAVKRYIMLLDLNADS